MLLYGIYIRCQHLFFINISIVNQVTLGFAYEYFCGCTRCDTVGYIYLYKNNIIIVIMVIVYSVLYCIHFAGLSNTGLYTILRPRQKGFVLGVGIVDAIALPEHAYARYRVGVGLTHASSSTAAQVA
jgi:hypothetical protein